MKSSLLAWWIAASAFLGLLAGAQAQTDPRVNHPEVFRQPLYWVGERPPAEEDTAKVMAAFDAQRPGNSFQLLEAFVAANPDSAWTPSVDANLAVAYRSAGLYTGALDHWEEAWAAVKDDESPGGRQVRGYVLGNWPGLLASLGRKDRLEEIAKEHHGRQIDNMKQQVAFNLAMESLQLMQQHPEMTYRCGPLALWNVAKALGLTNAAVANPASARQRGLPVHFRELARWGSPTNGFTADRLIEAAEGLNLGLVPVWRPSGSEIVAPSVIHWKQDHYAAIVGHTNGFCYIVDPTFAEGPHPVADAVVEEEASGFFMVPEKRAAKNWRRAAKEEASAVRGRGAYLAMLDSSEYYSPQCKTCKGMPEWWVSEPNVNLWMADEPVSWTTSEGQEMGFLLTSAQRMVNSDPTYNASSTAQVSGWNNSWLSWIVINDTSTLYPPYLCTYNGMNVYATPDPGGYSTSTTCLDSLLPKSGGDTLICGHYVPAGNYYTNTTVAGYIIGWDSDPNCPRWVYDPSLGYYIQYVTAAYHNSSMIIGDPSTLFQNISSTVYPAEGGSIAFGTFSAITGGLASAVDPQTKAQLIVTNNGALPNRITGATVLYPDGSQDQYTLVARSGPQAAVGYSGTTFSAVAYRTAHVAPNGRTTTFTFDSAHPTGNPIIRLASVTDSDGKTATLTYNTNYANLVAQVTDPYGRTAQMAYDATTHKLTQITDAQGMSSTISYGANGYISSLTTPYGTTTFTIPADVEQHVDVAGYGNLPNRMVLAQEPGGAVQLTTFEIANTLHPFLPSGSFDTNVFPQIPTNFASTTFDTGATYGTYYVGSSASNTLYLGAQWHNSFHWGRKQASKLSTTTVTNMIAADYALARVKHWLADQSGEFTMSVLSLEMEPSPDGVLSGGITWYDYPGKIATDTGTIGTNWSPSAIARRVPGGTTSWTLFQRNTNDLPTTIVSSYTKLDGTVGARTNTISYVNNVYPSVITRTDGSVAAGFAYDANHQVQYATNALGEITTAQYDGTTHKLTNIVFPNSLNLQLSWDSGAGGFLNHLTAAGYYTNILSFSNGQLHTLTDPLGLTRTFTYDNLDRLTEVDYPDSTSEKTTYSKLDVVQTIDRLGRTNLFGYNALGQMISATNALQAVTYFNRCVCGALESVVTPLGETTLYTYDNAGNLSQRLPADTDPVKFTYDGYHRLVTASDGTGTYSLSYNNQSRVTNIVSSLGNLWTGVYDIEDRLLRSTNRNGIGSTNTFDALNRLLTTTWPDGGVEKLYYSPGYRAATAYTNQVGQIQLIGFDGLQRLLTQAVPGVFTNTFAYNGASLVTNLLDGNGHKTTWAYDIYGRAIQKKDNAGNLVWTNGYNANGWLTAHYTPAKGLASYGYNAVGKLTNATFPTSTAQTYAYDADNRLQSMTDAVGTSSFAYNTFGALASEDGPWASDLVSYGYSSNRRRASLAVQQPTGEWDQTYRYDAASRLTNTTSPAGAFVYNYLSSAGNAASLVSQITLPSLGTIQNAFDSVGRMQSTALKTSGGTTLDSQTYVFDQAGYRTKTTYTSGNYWNYTYDNAGELLTAKGQESGGTTRSQEQLSYGYDFGGNLLNRTNNALIQALSVDSMNQLSSVASSGTLTVAGQATAASSSVTVNGSSASVYSDNSFAKTGQSFAAGPNAYTAVATQTGTGTISTATSIINIPSSNGFTYDADGNLIRDGLRQFEYDDQDQLIRVTTGIASRSEFTYDGLSRRRISKEYTLSFNSGAALIGVTALAPTTRNNYSGWVGSEITVGSSPIIVTDLGRWVKSGNSQAHAVKLVVASSSADVPGASVTIATSGATAGQYAYATLSTPVTLSPNTTYYLLSQETSGGDLWYEYTNTLAPATGLTIPGVVYGTGGTYTTAAGANQGFVPVGLKGVVSSTMLSVTTLSTTSRSDYSGWVGTWITVGTSPMAVTDLGRWVKSGNSGTHTVKIVRALDGTDVVGASVNINTSGATAGQYKYATLVAPVLLEANAAYYVMSQEVSGGDTWYDQDNALSASSGVTLTGVVYGTGGPGTWNTWNNGAHGYVPVGFKAAATTWTNTKETHYLYDGMLVIQERDGSNNPQVTYTRGKDLSGGRQGAGGIGGLLAYTSSGVSQFYHSDGLGNVTALANVNNALSASYSYDPYGNLLGSSGPMADVNRYRFSSKEFHSGSGTYSYGYRFYDPNLQKWLNRDPLGERGGINQYGFVENRPNGGVDPFGECEMVDGDTSGDEALGAVLILSLAAEGVEQLAYLIVGGVDVLSEKLLITKYVFGPGHPPSEALEALGALAEFEQLLNSLNAASAAMAARQAAAAAAAEAAAEAAAREAAAAKQAAAWSGACFVKGTPVATESGSKPIESIEVGDYIWAFDETTGVIQLKEVLAIYRNTSDSFAEVQVADETITATSEHPFWVNGRGWVGASHLTPGDFVTTLDGHVEAVKRAIKRTGTEGTFNLNVADFHTYFVGTSGIPVHNSSVLNPPGQCPAPGGAVPQKATDVLSHVRSKNNAPPGYKGHRPFANDGRGGGQVLPRVDTQGNPVTYREYDVNPYQPGVNRGLERIVVGTDGKAYYTSDHYGTFIPIP